jgi:hypothetical protein
VLDGYRSSHADREILLRFQPRALTAARGGVGAIVWDGALVLAAYLAGQLPGSFDGTVLTRSPSAALPPEATAAVASSVVRDAEPITSSACTPADADPRR